MNVGHNCLIHHRIWSLAIPRYICRWWWWWRWCVVVGRDDPTKLLDLWLIELFASRPPPPSNKNNLRIKLSGCTMYSIVNYWTEVEVEQPHLFKEWLEVVETIFYIQLRSVCGKEGGELSDENWLIDLCSIEISPLANCNLSYRIISLHKSLHIPTHDVSHWLTIGSETSLVCRSANQ